MEDSDNSQELNIPTRKSKNKPPIRSDLLQYTSKGKNRCGICGKRFVNFIKLILGCKISNHFQLNTRPMKASIFHDKLTAQSTFALAALTNSSIVSS